MRRWTEQPFLVGMLALGLVLGGGFLGQAIFLQQGPGSERNVPSNAESTAVGQKSQLTAEELEALQPEGLLTLYHFAGAVNNTSSSVERATVVQCTNVDDEEVSEIELQLFQFNATSVYTGTITADPLDTVTFESSSVDFYAADVLMGTGFVEQGYGRILTEHRNVICTVQTIDPNNTPPTWGFNLPLYAGPISRQFFPVTMNEVVP